MSNNKKTPRETGLEMVRKGFITQEKFQDMVNEGLIAGEKFSRNYYFEDTDMNIYFPGVVFKPSRKDGAKNRMTTDLKYVREDWKRRTQDIFQDILKEVAIFND